MAVGDSPDGNIAEAGGGVYDGSALALTDKDLLGRLVAFDSTSANSNLPIADFVCEYVERPGVAITRYPGPDNDPRHPVVAR